MDPSSWIVYTHRRVAVAVRIGSLHLVEQAWLDPIRLVPNYSINMDSLWFFCFLDGLNHPHFPSSDVRLSITTGDLGAVFPDFLGSLAGRCI